MIGLLIPHAFGQLTFSHMFGTEGDGTLQFKSPAGVAIDSEGKIYVADFKNSRIQVLDFSGNFETFFHTEGRAHGVEISNDKIYVAVWSDNPHIEIFDKNGTKISTIPGPELPADIAIDSFGKIYVTDYRTGIIQIFSPSGSLLKTLTVPSTSHGVEARLVGITLDHLGNIYVTDFLNHRVMKLDSSGNFLFEFIVPLEGGGKFDRPTNVEINPDGNIFVTDNSDRVLVFNSNGDFLYTFGESGKNAGQFSAPHGITFDNSGHVYVSEYGNHRIQIFDMLNSSQMPQNMTEQEEIRKAELSKSISWFDYVINYFKSIFNW